MVTTLSIPHEAIRDFCQQYRIRKLSIFGSALRPDFRPDSDVDFLVEFEPGHVPGLITLSRMRIELSELLGREADLRTPQSLSDYFRADVEAQTQSIYGQN